MVLQQEAMLFGGKHLRAVDTLVGAYRHGQDGRSVSAICSFRLLCGDTRALVLRLNSHLEDRYSFCYIPVNSR